VNIGIFIYDQAEVLDFSGPFEVFSTAKRMGANDWNIYLISEFMAPVVARGGYCVQPHYSINDHPIIDVLVVVGGVHTNELDKPQVIEWIRSIDRLAKKVVSVCTGAFLLAKADLLNGLTVTTHWEDVPDLVDTFPLLDVVTDTRWVSNGKYVTSGGISAGIDMSLYLVSELHSLKLAESVAYQMDYHWTIHKN